MHARVEGHTGKLKSTDRAKLACLACRRWVALAISQDSTDNQFLAITRNAMMNGLVNDAKQGQKNVYILHAARRL